MNRLVILSAAAGIALLGSPADAEAANTTVTFRVPVSVRGLDRSVHTVGVTCWILRKGNMGAGAKRVTFPVKFGQAYVRTLSIPVTLTPTQAQKAVSWDCMLGLNPTLNGMTIPSYHAPTSLSKAKAGTPLKVEVKGTFSRRLMPRHLGLPAR